MKQIMALLAFMLGTVVHAQPSAPMSPQNVQAPDGPLTGKMVDRVLDSYRALKREFDGYEGDGEGFGDYVQAQNAQSKAEAILSDHGYDNWQQWYGHFMKVTYTYAAYKTRDSRQVNRAEMEKQMRAIENNPQMSAEQKKMARQMMQMSSSMMKGYENVSESDIEAIKPHVDEIETVFQAE